MVLGAWSPTSDSDMARKEEDSKKNLVNAKAVLLQLAACC